MNHFILDGRYEDLLEHYGIDVSAALKKVDLPEFVILSEFAFLFAMLRRASQEEIKPVAVEMAVPVQDNEGVRDFFACPVKEGAENKITFAKSDLKLPFISYNQAMWGFFDIIHSIFKKLF